MIKIIITNTYIRTSKSISHVRHTATNRPSKNYIPLFTNPFSAHFFINQFRIRIRIFRIYIIINFIAQILKLVPYHYIRLTPISRSIRSLSFGSTKKNKKNYILRNINNNFTFLELHKS